jgi:molybdopterin biosynthesis enzyme MoaB
MFVKASEIEKGSVMGILYSLEGVMVVSLAEDPEAIKQCLKAIMDKLDNKISEQSQNDRAGDAK